MNENASFQQALDQNKFELLKKKSQISNVEQFSVKDSTTKQCTPEKTPLANKISSMIYAISIQPWELILINYAILPFLEGQKDAIMIMGRQYHKNRCQ
jgi:hypothetical protein